MFLSHSALTEQVGEPHFIFSQFWQLSNDLARYYMAAAFVVRQGDRLLEPAGTQVQTHAHCGTV